MTDALTFEQAQERLEDARQSVIAAHAHCELCAAHAADAEAVYRNELAAAFKRYRLERKAVEESMTLARAEVARHSRERDWAQSQLRLAHERIEDARDDRRSLWRLVEWSREVRVRD